MKYRLIALDVDGTLLNDDHVLTEKTIATIQEVHDQGCHIVLCTGRAPDSTLPLLQQLGLEGTMITHNGAATVYADERGLTLVNEFAFTVPEIEPMLNYVRREAIHFDVCTSFNMYIERISDYEKQMYKKFLITPKLVTSVSELGLPIVKYTLFSQPDVLDRVQQDWEEQQLYGHLRMIRSGDLFIDVMNPIANKGNALKTLASSLEIDPSEIMAIGNYFNDLEMMDFAGLGVAVANSPEGVLQAADVITSSNNDEGVHEALIKYCLSY
ncbi:sugar phosphate phosphatase [Paenibacillus marchantiophytorum]|uniref:Sugar phosphate phosphatase n=1 Tax=Paenibacillus marchantiophytorum TaxID=1619310 RepID=A0ABQ2BST7_9BACL|nr:Cof-type HAD-IIB family hydrolase [Paenibacillus marchantiophytorum]GGI45364.1 sugar phosphate phosphatase [Paenibacillus marchantiophytorum]